MITPNQIRNVAIVAHIDHGKTTLLDAFLKQSRVFRDGQEIPERVMDSYDQERERGITIFSKPSSIIFKDFKINIIDTPGHADFSGEVERVLDMVNSVLLVVDSREGPMPQTRYVLSQALKRGLRPIVVINKIDKPHADPDDVLSQTFDLFVELGANDDQLDFPYIFASGINGYACHSLKDPCTNMDPLFQLIIDKVPAPPGTLDETFLMQVATVPYDDFLGRGACGRILKGKIQKGVQINHLDLNDNCRLMKVSRIKTYNGITPTDTECAGAGDIAIIYGIPEVLIGDTLSDPAESTRLPALSIEEPTISINFMVNSGPLVGREGQHVTMNKIRERLLREKRTNITLRIEEIPGVQDAMKVSGKGELHLAVLIEAMRREGYEFCVSKPKVVTKVENGILYEAQERIFLELPETYNGVVIEELMRRKAEMHSLDASDHGICFMEFLIPTRGLMGFRHDYLTMTRGEGIMTKLFEGFVPWRGDIPHRANGVMISAGPGKATPYACFNLQERGKLITAPGEDVYEGMIVGEHCRDSDIVVNITREKHLSNVRASGKDENVILTPPYRMTLEQAINYIKEDELVEVTPKTFRFRKIFLKEHERKRAKNA